MIKNFSEDKSLVKGLAGKVFVKKGIAGLKYFCNITQEENSTRLNFFKMPGSLTCLIKTRFGLNTMRSVEELKNLEEWTDECYDNISIPESNHILFRCENEENQVSSKKRGIYQFNQYFIQFLFIQY